MNTKTHIKQENKNRTKRSDITPIVNTLYGKKLKQGPTPDKTMNKNHHQNTTNPTTTNPNMTKHKRAYLLKERERRQIQRSRIKEQKIQTKPTTGTTVAQNLHPTPRTVRIRVLGRRCCCAVAPHVSWRTFSLSS